MLARWIFSTNAKDILRHGGRLCCAPINHKVARSTVAQWWGSLFGVAPSNEAVSRVPMDSLNFCVLRLTGGMACSKLTCMSLRQLNHRFKIGPLAVDYAIPLTTRSLAVNLFDVYGLRATCLSIPIQVETHVLLHY
jgi:hypothetical protein